MSEYKTNKINRLHRALVLMDIVIEDLGVADLDVVIHSVLNTLHDLVLKEHKKQMEKR